MVGRQLEHRHRVGELLDPVILGRDVDRRVATSVVGAREGAELRRHGQRGGPATAPRGIEFAEIAEQDALRPAVVDQVVRDEHQAVLLGGDADQLHAEQRPVDQIEGLAGPLVDERFHLRLLLARRQVREIHDREIDLQRRRDALVIAGRAERGAQRVVAGDQLLDRDIQVFDVERSGQPQRKRFVVGGGGLRAHLRGEPHLVLLGRQRDRQLLGGLGHRLGGGFGQARFSANRSVLLYMRGELFQAADAVEHLAQRDFHAEPGLHRLARLREQQGIQAEFDERCRLVGVRHLETGQFLKQRFQRVEPRGLGVRRRFHIRGLSFYGIHKVMGVVVMRLA